MQISNCITHSVGNKHVPLIIWSISSVLGYFYAFANASFLSDLSRSIPYICRPLFEWHCILPVLYCFFPLLKSQIIIYLFFHLHGFSYGVTIIGFLLSYSSAGWIICIYYLLFSSVSLLCFVLYYNQHILNDRPIVLSFYYLSVFVLYYLTSLSVSIIDKRVMI